jgi:hypothetical protein
MIKKFIYFNLVLLFVLASSLTVVATPFTPKPFGKSAAVAITNYWAINHKAILSCF